MIAFKMLREALTPTSMHGHIPGVEIGARFGGRGEVAIVGIHTQMMRGIDSRWVCNQGCNLTAGPASKAVSYMQQLLACEK